MEKKGPISVQHYAFLVEDGRFDKIFSRIREARLGYWADPGKSRSEEINQNDGARGVYFEDLDGHAITRPYGNAAPSIAL